MHLFKIFILSHAHIGPVKSNIYARDLAHSLTSVCTDLTDFRACVHAPNKCHSEDIHCFTLMAVSSPRAIPWPLALPIPRPRPILDDGAASSTSTGNSPFTYCQTIVVFTPGLVSLELR